MVTDALEMAGVRRGTWTGEAAVKAVRAGADVILLPPEADVAIQSLVRAVREGILTEARINESAGRVLAAKESLGLLGTAVRADGTDKSVGRPEDIEQALEIARRSITVVRNEGGVLPLRAEEPLRLLHLVMSSDPRTDANVIQGFPEDELTRRRIPFETVYVGPDVVRGAGRRPSCRRRGRPRTCSRPFSRAWPRSAAPPTCRPARLRSCGGCAPRPRRL